MMFRWSYLINVNIRYWSFIFDFPEWPEGIVVEVWEVGILLFNFLLLEAAMSYRRLRLLCLYLNFNFGSVERMRNI